MGQTGTLSLNIFKYLFVRRLAEDMKRKIPQESLLCCIILLKQNRIKLGEYKACSSQWKFIRLVQTLCKS